MKTILNLYAQFKLGGSGELGLPGVNADDNSLRAIFSTIFLFIGALSVIFLIYGGISYALSTGNPDKAKQAWQTVLYSLIGLVVSVSAVTLITLVIGRLS
jgi:hypothetical protein